MHRPFFQPVQFDFGFGLRAITDAPDCGMVLLQKIETIEDVRNAGLEPALRVIVFKPVFFARFLERRYGVTLREIVRVERLPNGNAMTSF